MTLASIINPAQTPAQATPLVPNGSASASGGISFGDVLDAVNPLQHIPIVSNLYRAATGSQISAGSQIAGDTLYGALFPGGAIAGLVSSAADVAVKAVSGKTIAGNALSIVSPSSSTSQTAGTPLVPTTQPHVAATTTGSQTPISPIPLSSRAGHSVNSQYERAQALDSLNQKLVKLKI